MDWEGHYNNSKRKLLTSREICEENIKLFRKFFEFQEYKLKRQNGIPKLDDGTYKTLISYITRIRVVNRWFINKPWVKLTKKDIKQVYDDIEDGNIKTRLGKPLKDKRTYYMMIIRGKPFEMAGKEKLAKEVMEFYVPNRKEEVRFIKEEDFRKIAEVMLKSDHKTLFWLLWDIGENASSILRLRKRDLTKQINEETKEPEYLVNLRKEILKRSRTARSEITNYKETVLYLDLILKDKEEDDLLFDYGPPNAKRLIGRAVSITKVKCLPAGQKVTLKDLRSSMACDLLSKGWSRDEVNARLGHTPSSREIDKYINYLAIDRSRPKKKIYDNTITKLTGEVEEFKEREKLNKKRSENMKKEIEAMKEEYEEKLETLTNSLQELRETVSNTIMK